jgi:hypothetical protein
MWERRSDLDESLWVLTVTMWHVARGVEFELVHGGTSCERTRCTQMPPLWIIREMDADTMHESVSINIDRYRVGGRTIVGQILI